MRLRRFRNYAIGAGGMLVLVMAILLATGWGTAVAAQITNVFVTNDASHAVPVREQGTTNVNVTNGGGRVIPLAHDVTVGLAGHFDSPIVATGDCKRLIVYSYSDPGSTYSVFLLARANSESPAVFYVDSETTADAGTGARANDFLVTTTGAPVVTPFAQVSFSSLNGFHLRDAYLFCGS
jgi:hypothetical protein